MLGPFSLTNQGGGANQKVFFMEQDKTTHRQEICDNTVSGISFLLC